jgi:hypothetical protein
MSSIAHPGVSHARVLACENCRQYDPDGAALLSNALRLMANCLERVGVRENVSSTLLQYRFNTPGFTLAYAIFSTTPRRHKKTRMYALRTLRNSMHVPPLLDQTWPQEKTAT